MNIVTLFMTHTQTPLIVQSIESCLSHVVKDAKIAGAFGIAFL